MIFHAGLTEFGFASAEGFIAWLAGTGALLVLYWVFWLLYFRAAKPPGTRCRWLCCPA